MYYGRKSEGKKTKVVRLTPKKDEAPKAPKSKKAKVKSKEVTV